MTAVNRWFLKCETCLAVSAVDEHPNIGEWQCGICGGRFENMGRVERDRLIDERYTAICDERCTSARGPLCSCACGGRHHGSNRVVRVVRDSGPIPTVTPHDGREQARLNAREFKMLCAAALALLEPLRASKRKGYLPRGEYDRMIALDRAMEKAYKARSHTTRVKTLRAVVGDLRVADPIADVAVETHTAIAAAPPVADAPFTLTAPKDDRRATQQPLF